MEVIQNCIEFVTSRLKLVKVSATSAAVGSITAHGIAVVVASEFL